MTSLAERLPTLTDADLKSLRANAERLASAGSPVQAASAAEIVPLIDAELAVRAARPAPPKKPRAPVKKKLPPATGHQTALNSDAA